MLEFIIRPPVGVFEMHLLKHLDKKRSHRPFKVNYLTKPEIDAAEHVFTVLSTFNTPVYYFTSFVFRWITLNTCGVTNSGNTGK